MLKHIKGNLIDLAEQGHFDVIVHGCNCQNTMGSGIAKEIKERYPEAYEVDELYSTRISNPIHLLGNYSYTEYQAINANKFTIINAYTQVNYLPRGVDHFEYESFAIILKKLSIVYPEGNFGLPYIGMGLAGGKPDPILNMIKEFAKQVTSTGGSVTLVEYDG